MNRVRGFTLIELMTVLTVAVILAILGAGLYLWTFIVALFFKWAARHGAAERAGVLVTEREVLTWDEVEAELADLDRRGA